MRTLTARLVFTVLFGCGFWASRIGLGLFLLTPFSLSTAQAAEQTLIYSNSGQLKAVIDSATATTTVWTYDATGNVLSITQQNATLLSLIETTPSCGTAGTTQVTLAGTGFHPTASQVTFNGVVAPITTAAATHLVTSMPTGAPTGPSTITITTLSGSTPTAARRSTPTTVPIACSPLPTLATSSPSPTSTTPRAG